MSAQLTYDRPQTPTVTAVRHGRIRGTWRRIRTTISDMNYGVRRFGEVQAPWSVDAHWDNR
jgi:hypothetical protein